MLRSILIVVFCLSLFGLKAQKNEEFSQTRIIVKLHNNVDAAHFFTQTLELGEDFNYRPMRSKRITSIYFMDFDLPQNVLTIIERLQTYKEVNSVEPDYIGYGGGQMMMEPNDPLYNSRQYGLENTGSFSLSDATVDADIDMEAAWEYSTGCDDIVIAVLDSGIKFDHPELADNVWVNIDEVNDGLDTDNNGFINDNIGWNFAYNNNNPVDDHGHGTNVSGIVSGEGDNSLGYAGVNWDSPFMTLKILNSSNSGFYSWWTEAIYYAVDNGANVINMSVGGSSYSSFMDDAVNYAHENDVAVVACMMNFNVEAPYYPAGFTNTFAIGATDAEDNRVEPFFWSTSSGSNFGDHMDIVAPGNYIYGLSHSSNSNFNSYWGGTSQSTPLVTGVASLMYCITGSYEGIVDDIRNTLRETAQDEVGLANEDSQGFDKFYGWGRMNAADALEAWSQTVNVQESLKYSLTVSPNPSTDIVKVSWDMPTVKTVELLNINGQLIYSKSLQQETSVIFDNLEKGVYIIKINNDSETISKKLIVQ